MLGMLVGATRLNRDDAGMPRSDVRPRSRKTWFMLVLLTGIAASAGFWIGAISFQFKLKPYYYALKVINRVSSFDPEKDFVYRTLSTLYRTQPYTRDVTFVGDSIVAFGKWDVLLKTDRIDNHGIPGDTTQGLLLRVRRHEVIGKTVIVMLGVNDLKMEISQAATVDNIRGIVASLRGHRIILVSTLRTAIPSTNAKLAEIIAFEKAICAAGDCTYHDVNRVLAPSGILEDRFTTDGVHLSWLGYEVVARELANVVKFPAPMSSPSPRQ